jgi:hypothetical protein
MRRRKKIAVEFADDAEFRKGLAVLDDVEGDWALPGLHAIIIEESDLPFFERAGVTFTTVPVVPMSSVTPEERAAIRRNARNSIPFR